MNLTAQTKVQFLECYEEYSTTFKILHVYKWIFQKFE